MTEQELQSLQDSDVAIGQVFPSFNALCKFVGVIPKSGGHARTYIERQLQCFLTWEKIEGTHKLVITDTHYDDPRPYTDGRRGIHSTPENLAMQYYMLLSDQLFERGETANGLLIKMGLILPDKTYNYRIPVYQDYLDKLSKLLKSALIQLQKRGLISYTSRYYSRDPVHRALTEEECTRYQEILTETLNEYNEKNIRMVILHGRGPDFWSSVNEKTREELGANRIATYYELYSKIHEGQERALYEQIAESLPLSDEEKEATLNDIEVASELRALVYSKLTNCISQNLADRYKQKNPSAVGIASPDQYAKYVKEIQQDININTRYSNHM